MIQQLTIQNFALIDELEISFSKGMTIITGETGAGKSILLGALSLLLGNRADPSVLNTKTKKCIIEGVFNINGYHLQEFFSSNDLDFDTNTTIRREISTEGKSRAFINDSPVNLNVLRELSGRMIEIHSQHETLTLNDSGFQMMVLDSYAMNEKSLMEYKTTYSHYTSTRRKLEELKEQEAKAKADQDYFQFQFKEINDAQLKTGEQEELENEITLLNNSEGIKSALSNASQVINLNDDNLLGALSSVLSTLQPYEKVHSGVNEVVQRLASAKIEIKDIADEIESIDQNVLFNPARAEIITDRLDLIYRLEQKHRVKGVDELSKIGEEFKLKLESISSLEEETGKLEIEITLTESKLKKLATTLRSRRIKVVPEIEKNIKSTLTDLGMKHAVLKLEMEHLSDGIFKENGSDKVRFLFSANKGIEYRELSKVASGGELSRLMLSIKAMIAKLTGLPTIIFDEIDTGISGEIAHKVGKILKAMSAERQVIAITHLPQMAGKGDDHLFVFKEVIEGRTTTMIRKLGKQERVEEIAKMLSGDEPTKAAIANARELLDA